MNTFILQCTLNFGHVQNPSVTCETHITLLPFIAPPYCNQSTVKLVFPEKMEFLPAIKPSIIWCLTAVTTTTTDAHITLKTTCDFDTSQWFFYMTNLSQRPHRKDDQKSSHSPLDDKLVRFLPPEWQWTQRKTTRRKSLDFVISQQAAVQRTPAQKVLLNLSVPA